MAGPIRVFIATSLDGFIAGENDDLSWLPMPEPGGEDYGFGDHMAQTAAILMGRGTYDVASSFEGEWPYGETPLFVATSRPLPEGAPSSVRAVSGDAVDLVAAVQAEVGDGGVGRSAPDATWRVPRTGSLCHLRRSLGRIRRKTRGFHPTLPRGLRPAETAHARARRRPRRRSR